MWRGSRTTLADRSHFRSAEPDFSRRHMNFQFCVMLRSDSWSFQTKGSSLNTLLTLSGQYIYFLFHFFNFPTFFFGSNYLFLDFGASWFSLSSFTPVQFYCYNICLINCLTEIILKTKHEMRRQMRQKMRSQYIWILFSLDDHMHWWVLIIFPDLWWGSQQTDQISIDHLPPWPSFSSLCEIRVFEFFVTKQLFFFN